MLGKNTFLWPNEKHFGPTQYRTQQVIKARREVSYTYACLEICVFDKICAAWMIESSM